MGFFGLHELIQAQVDALKVQFGVDQPFMVQYGRWMSGIVRGDRAFVPRGQSRIKSGDRLIVIALPRKSISRFPLPLNVPSVSSMVSPSVDASIAA